MRTFSSANEFLFSNNAFCLVDGTRVTGAKPTAWKRCLDEDGEDEWLDGDQEWDQEILAALDGDRNLLVLLKRLANAELSYAEIAAGVGRCTRTVIVNVHRLLARLHVTLVARAARRGLEADGGCMVGPNARRLGPIDAFAVSLAGTEQRFRQPPDVQRISRYIRRFRTQLLESRNALLGGWYDSTRKLWCLDLSIRVARRDDAELLGRLNGQRCIYHLKTKQEIWLEPPRQRNAGRHVGATTR